MELRHLRYFIAVAEEKHMTRAARRLGIQQPPLSLQIRALEMELDVQLFRRKPRGVELTDAGAAFLDRARAILDQVERATATTRRTARGEQGRVVVGFTSSAPFHPFVPRVIRAYREMSPLVSLVLEESGSSELVQALHNEEIDAAFIRSPVADVMGLNVRPLLEERMVVAMPSGHPLGKGANKAPPLPLSAFAKETFILYKRPGGPGLYDTIITACRSAGFSPRVGQEAPRIISTLN
ncbi:MAG: LysR family transcriptional regulator, partial [Lysobacterales bacterium]